MKMSLQNQYTLDMEKERGQMALLQFYDLGGGGGIAAIILTI